MLRKKFSVTKDIFRVKERVEMRPNFRRKNHKRTVKE